MRIAHSANEVADGYATAMREAASVLATTEFS